MLFRVLLLLLTRTQIERLTTQEQSNELLLFSWQSGCNAETHWHDCLNCVASSRDRSFLMSRQLFCALFWSPAPVTWCVSSSLPRAQAGNHTMFFGTSIILLPLIPLCPRMNRQRRRAFSVFYRGLITNTLAQEAPTTVWSLGEMEPKSHPLPRL